MGKLRNKEKALEAIKNEGLWLKDVVDSLKEDKDVCMAAIQHHWGERNCIGENLKEDEDLVKAAFKSFKEHIADDSVKYGKLPEPVFKGAIITDKDFALEVANFGKEQNIWLRHFYERFSNELKADKDFILQIADIDKEVLYHASNGLKQNGDFIKSVLPKMDINILRIYEEENDIGFAPDSDTTPVIPFDKETALKIIENTTIIHFNSTSNIMAIAESYKPLFDINKEKIIDKDIAISLVKKDGTLFEKSYMENFWKDKDVILEALKTHYELSQNLLTPFKDDKDVVEGVIEAGGYIDFASDKIKTDRDLMLKAVNYQPANYECISPELKDNLSFTWEAIKINPAVINFASSQVEKILLMNTKSLDEKLKEASSMKKEANKDTIPYESKHFFKKVA